LGDVTGSAPDTEAGALTELKSENKMKRSALMYCCRSAMRSGNLKRTMEVARKLSESFEVTVLLGDAAAARIEFPDNITTVLLPTLGIDPDTNVFDIRSSQDLRDRVIARRNVLIREFERLKPRVVAIEDFPFRQHALRGEVLPLIERARNGVFGDALVVSLTDGIIADDVERDDTFRDEAARLLDKYFDMVVVQSDPVFARIEEFFQPQNVLHVPVYHTGFVSPDNGAVRKGAGLAPDSVLVSAGDGEHGGPLFRAAVEAHRILGSRLLLPMKIVTGEGLSDDEWRQLKGMAEVSPDLTVERSLADIGAALATARWSVSQCEYSTAVHTMQSRTPSLFVPSGNGDRQAQIVRAQRLVYWGAGRLLLPQHLNGASLANEIHELMRFQPRPMHFDLNGAENAASLIAQAAYHNDIASEAAQPDASERRPH
jgi:predicted glycosyltransferase